MSILVIDDIIKARVKQALVTARQNPLPWQATKAVVDSNQKTNHTSLADRKPGVETLRRKYPSQHIMLGTYRAALSYEEQPTGMLKHLSISSHRKGMVPGLEVMQAVAELFEFTGFPPPNNPHRIWTEEFEPGHFAVNIVELENITQ
jgi:hypothetical protein